MSGGRAGQLRQVLPEAPLDISELQESAADAGEQAGVEQPTLVGTKLRPPAVRDQSIPRQRLLEDLRSGSDRRLTLVACPAGFGKTTLLSAWYEAEAARDSLRGSRWTRVTTTL